jgi:uncharacterized protein
MGVVTHDRNGLEILDRASCLELLATAHVGRIALSMGALPVVLPVTFAMLGDDVLIGTVSGSRLEAAATNAVVAFEADRIDAIDQDGWSVLIQGVAAKITDPVELELARQALLTSSPGVEGHYLRVASQVVSGRRLYPGGSWGKVASRAVD